MKVLLLSIIVAISTNCASTTNIGVIELTVGAYILPNDVESFCNDPPELHLPHPWDCTKFYRCVANRKIWLKCPSTLYFNRVLEVCDWPGHSGCIPGTPPPTETTIKPPPTQTTTAKPPTQTTTVKPPTQTTTVKPPTQTTTAKPPTQTTTVKPPTETTPKPTVPPSGDCPAGIDKNFHPNLNDCRKYWQCIEGIRNDYSCPFGSYFNPKTVDCERNNGQCNK